MTSNDLESQENTRFKASLKQFAYQTHPSSSSPRRSLRQQQVDSPSPRKRKSTDKSDLELSSSPSPSREKSKSRLQKRKKGYAPPEEYAHLRGLNDCVRMHLDILFCGINPGVLSATIGHHFAHPSNRFYKALHGAGLTKERVDPTEDHTLPERYNIGITDLVDRPSASADQLKKSEFRESTPELLRKIARYKPRIVCFVGMGMYAEVEKVFDEMIAAENLNNTSNPITGKSPKKNREASLVPGLRPYKIIYTGKYADPVEETLFFSSPSTSGLAAAYKENDIVALYSDLRELVSSHKSKAIDTSQMKSVPVQHESD